MSVVPIVFGSIALALGAAFVAIARPLAAARRRSGPTGSLKERAVFWVAVGALLVVAGLVQIVRGVAA